MGLCGRAHNKQRCSKRKLWGYWWATCALFSILNSLLFPFFILIHRFHLMCWFMLLVVLLWMTPVGCVCVQEGVGQKKTAALGFDRRLNEFCCVWLLGQSGGQFELNRRNFNIFIWAVAVNVRDSRTLLCLRVRQWYSLSTLCQVVNSQRFWSAAFLCLSDCAFNARAFC